MDPNMCILLEKGFKTANYITKTDGLGLKTNKQIVGQMFQIILENGSFLKLHKDTILTLYNILTRKKYMAAIEVIAVYNTETLRRNRIVSNCVSFEEREIKTDPYLVGMLLSCDINRFSIEEALKEYILIRMNDWELEDGMEIGRLNTTEMIQIVFRQIIPDSYIYNSSYIRHQVLLGYIRKNTVQKNKERRLCDLTIVSLKNLILSQQICFLLASTGFRFRYKYPYLRIYGNILALPRHEVSYGFTIKSIGKGNCVKIKARKKLITYPDCITLN